MLVDPKSAALGAAAFLVLAALVGAQASIGAVKVLEAKITSPVDVAPHPRAFVDIKEGETYVVPAGRILVAAYAYGLPDPTISSIAGEEEFLVKRNGVAEGRVRAWSLEYFTPSQGSGPAGFPPGMYRFYGGESVTVEDITTTQGSGVAENRVGVLVCYLVDA